MSLRTSLLLSVICLAMSSCFKDEPLNDECDIEQAYVHVDNPEEIFYNVTDTLVTVATDANEVNFKVRDNTDLTSFAPVFTITDGATIEPASGTTHDFSNGPVTYTVTSEDGAYTRTYDVQFKFATVTTTDTICYDFEYFYYYYNTEGEAKYYVWSDYNEDGTLAYNWATANGGYMLSRGSVAPDEYPTVPVEGYEGYGVKLETLSTGSFGEMVNKRLAAGNFFIGTFDMSSVLTNSLAATCFGLPFDRKPVKFTGYYKFLPGDDYQDIDGNILEDQSDGARVYSVFYRNHDDDNNEVMLHGDDVITNENIVALADDGTIYEEAAEWTFFEMDFDYGDNEVDYDLLDNQGYNLTIVFSSSDNGKYYEGAIGSQLYIDKVRIICEPEDEE